MKTTKRRRTTAKATSSKGISPELEEAFIRFIEYHDANRLSANLRSMLLEFLMYDGSVEAEYLKPLVIDLSGLFELLEVVREERVKRLI